MSSAFPSNKRFRPCNICVCVKRQVEIILHSFLEKFWIWALSVVVVSFKYNKTQIGHINLELGVIENRINTVHIKLQHHSMKTFRHYVIVVDNSNYELVNL